MIELEIFACAPLNTLGPEERMTISPVLLNATPEVTLFHLTWFPAFCF